MLNIFHIITNGLVLLLPAMTNLVEHAGSTLMSILILLGIILFFKSGRISLYRQEKWVMGAFAGYFFICLLMHAGYMISGQIPVEWDLDSEIRMFAFILVYYLFVQVRLKQSFLWNGMIIGAVASGLYALTIAIIYNFPNRVVGPYNPCLFGYLSVALAFMSLSGHHLFYKKKKIFILLPILAFASGLLAAFFSGTRGSIMSVPFLIILFLFQIKGRLKQANVKIVIGGVLSVFCILMIVYPYIPLSNRVERGMQDAVFFVKHLYCVDCLEKAPSARLRMWRESLLIIQDHPIFGVGPTGYQQIVTKRVQNGTISSGIEQHQSPHNMYLTMMTAYGIPGIIAILALYLCPLAVYIGVIKGNKTNENARGPAFCGLFLITGFMLFSVTDTPFIRNMLIAFYMVMNAALLSACRPFFSEPQRDTSSMVAPANNGCPAYRN
ncbi:MAG: O-antigen ligase family protein [Thermodesulfobacteriota bacterium]